MAENDPISTGPPDMNGLSEHQQFLNDLGLSADRRFLSGPSPRKPNIDDVRAYYKGELPADDQSEVEACILNFEEWDKLSRQVLVERAEAQRGQESIQRQVENLMDEDDA
jgi:hypothetical protein